MFITLTIDTNKKKKSPVRVHKRNFNPAKGWRKAVHFKKRSVFQRIKDWRKSLKHGQYSLDGQVAMFNQ